MADAEREQVRNEFTAKQFAATAKDFEGASAIYMEDKTFALVRVHALKYDDWGVSLTITCIPIDGLGKIGKEQLDSSQLGASWEIFAQYGPRWSARYSLWKLFFGHSFVELAHRLAAESIGQAVPFDLVEAELRVYELELEIRAANHADTLTGLESSGPISNGSEGNG